MSDQTISAGEQNESVLAHDEAIKTGPEQVPELSQSSSKKKRRPAKKFKSGSMINLSSKDLEKSIESPSKSLRSQSLHSVRKPIASVAFPRQCYQAVMPKMNGDMSISCESLAEIGCDMSILEQQDLNADQSDSIENEQGVAAIESSPPDAQNEAEEESAVGFSNTQRPSRRTMLQKRPRIRSGSDGSPVVKRIVSWRKSLRASRVFIDFHGL